MYVGQLASSSNYLCVLYIIGLELSLRVCGIALLHNGAVKALGHDAVNLVSSRLQNNGESVTFS